MVPPFVGGALPVPMHLRNASSSLGRALGFGQGYQYPHNFEGHYVVDTYLPEVLRCRHYYEPSKSGREREIGDVLIACDQRSTKKPNLFLVPREIWDTSG